MDALNRILQIDFCKPGQPRYREPVTRSGSHERIIHWSPKVDRGIHGDHPNEGDVFMDLDCDPTIKTYREQPCRITYLLAGEEHCHDPDLFETPFSGFDVLSEIKLAAEAASEEVRSRTKVMTLGLPAFGLRYRVRLVERSQHEPERRNRTILIGFANRQATMQERESILLACRRHDYVSWLEVCHGRYGQFGREIVCRLFIDGVLATDLSRPLNDLRFVPREERR